MKQRVKSCSRGDYKKRIIYYNRGTDQLSGEVEELSTCDDDTDCSELDAFDSQTEINEDVNSSPANLLVGDIVWAKCPGHNWWPSMIAYDPNTAVYFQIHARTKTPYKYHVQFFGSRPLRGWVTKSNIIKFEGLVHFQNKITFSSATQKEFWGEAVQGAEDAIQLDLKEERLSFLFDYHRNPQFWKKKSKKRGPSKIVQQALTNVVKRRSSRLVETSITDSSSDSLEAVKINTNKPNTVLLDNSNLLISNANKSKSVDHKSVLQDITNKVENNSPDGNIENSYDSGIEDSENLNSSCDDMDLLGPKRKRKPKVFEGYHTGNELNNAFKNKNKEKLDLVKEYSIQPVPDIVVDKENSLNDQTGVLSSTLNDSVIDKSENSASSELSSNEKDTSISFNGKRKRATKKVENVTEPDNINKKKDLSKAAISNKSNLKKIKDNSSTVLSEESKNFKKTFRDNLNHIVEQSDTKEDSEEHFCLVCEDTSGEFLACNGSCLNYFHANCLGLNTSPDNFVCDECSSGVHICFVCHKPGDTIKCSLETCGKYYHVECVDKYECTKFANKAKDKFTCPMHTCHYCSKDKSLKMSTSKKTVSCIRCPSVYHLDHCLPAGCSMVTSSHMICVEHFDPSKSNNPLQVNTTWCIECAQGGALVCCDTCPASYHPACTEDLEDVPEGVWRCQDCVDGNKLRYGDIVWVKFSMYRWWPGKICLPEEIPVNIQNMPHTVGEFPVLFFGSHDYAWLNSRRVFKYAEGDTGGATSKSYLAKYFEKALEEAKVEFSEMKKKKEEHIQKLDKKQSNKPPSYGNAKANKPVSCVRTILDRSEWPICQCTSQDLCEKECLNKMLYYECSPTQCPNKENCKNQRMQKCIYAKTKTYKAEERGWGLLADQEIKSGDFVIEYVGELIDEATCRNRIQQYHEKDIYDYYFLTIDRDNIIDAYPRGNLSRFMNHSCDPNCETQKWTVNGEVRVGLFALRDIAVGDELSFNYNLDCLGNEKKKCKCGSANCSGYLGVRPKTQHSMALAEKSKKTKKETKDKRKVKKRVKKIVHEDECFSCGDGGDLLCCDRLNCTKAYHQDCLIMEAPPKGKWQCPWHFCDECGKLARSMCSLCPNSFCESHLDDQMKELMDDVLVCPVHDDEEMEALKKEKLNKSSGSATEGDSSGTEKKTSAKSATKNTEKKKEEKSTNSSKKKKSASIKSSKVTNVVTTDQESSESEAAPKTKFTNVKKKEKKTLPTKTSSKVKSSKTNKTVSSSKKSNDETSDSKKSGIGEKRKHLIKAAQKAKELKMKKKAKESSSSK